MSCLNIEKVSCHYNGRPVLEQLSLQVSDNEIVCLLGASGCGKTTLLKAVAGLLPLAQGEIRLGETLLDAPGVSVPPEARHIGMIFQDHRLLMDRTVFDNVALPLVIDGYSHGDINKRVAAALDKVGLLGKERYQPRMLSGGEQQRVGIARVLYQRAELILADEPVSAMDPVLAGHTLALLNREAAARGSTLLASLHAVDLALQHFPRVIGLRAGRIAFDLPAGEVDRAALDALYANEQLQAERASPAGEPAVVHIPRC